jgi:hypothetical protein
MDNVSANLNRFVLESLALGVYFSLQASSDGNGNIDAIKNILGKLPSSGGGSSDQKMSQAENLKAKSQAYHFDPNNVAPPEVRKQLMDLLKWHDGVYRDVLSSVEMIPGLESLVDNLSNALNACTPLTIPLHAEL